MLVGRHRNDQVLRPHAAFGLQSLRQFRIRSHLLPGRPALLKDLDDHDAVRALQAETRVLGNDVTVDVLGDDLVSIARRSGKNVEHHVLDGVSQSAEFSRGSTLLDIDPDQWHGYNPILLRHNVKLRTCSLLGSQRPRRGGSPPTPAVPAAEPPLTWAYW